MVLKLVDRSSLTETYKKAHTLFTHMEGLVGCQGLVQVWQSNESEQWRATKFWEDCWLGCCPLKIEFDKLYRIYLDSEIVVAGACVDGTWNIRFRRSLCQEVEEWTCLQTKLGGGVVLADGRDEMSWALEKTGKYTIKSLYNLITFGGVRDVQMLDIWGTKIPLKIQILLWMAFHDRIQSAVQLKKKKWAGKITCKMCNRRETSDHIMFQYPIANFLWSFLKETLIWPSICV